MKLKLDWFRGKTFQRLALKKQAASRLPQHTPLLKGSLGIYGKASGVRYIAQSLLWSGVIALSWGAATPVLAAERLTLRLGPFEQSVDIEDLEEFAKTGKLSTSLKPYAPLLTPQVQEMLSRRLQIDPNLADKFIDDLLRSPNGEQLIKQIRVAVPNSSVEQVRVGLALAMRQANGMSAISFLRAYPDENITVDASSAIAIALQINAPYLQSQAVTSLLERELSAPNSSFKPSFDPAAAGSKMVHKQTLALQDQRRNRTIPADIYWNDTTTGPLVVISHGFGANREFLGYLARHLASHGLTVAAIDHADSNIRGLSVASIGSNPSNLLPASEFVERPKDISFLLDQLTQLNQQPGPLQGRLNTQQVTAIGHSLGGYTVLALAGAELNLDELRQFCKERSVLSKAGGDWLQCAASELSERRVTLRDQRVVQAIALNPVSGNIFGKNGLAKVTIPTLIWTSTADALTPALTHQLRPFAKLSGSKYLVTAIGGTHLSVGDPGNLNPELAKNTLVPEITGEKAYPVRQLVRGVSLAFIKQLTPEAKTYEPFLTSAYAQSLSAPGLNLRLNTQLPPSISAFVELP
ncbi:MAG: alpha/beta hydrolase [Aphanothece sp. CMT-3BRIN-NPC111]|jgi:predicted dienelactone hydrolase|nr:alpha/beta hydrolase [Aphanothece sp. CMT-3BRIN-NPC111]